MITFEVWKETITEQALKFHKNVYFNNEMKKIINFMVCPIGDVEGKHVHTRSHKVAINELNKFLEKVYALHEVVKIRCAEINSGEEYDTYVVRCVLEDEFNAAPACSSL